MIGRRRGIIGFVVTMAVGIALGAATLFVGSEVAKNLDQEKKPGPPAVYFPSPAAIEVDAAFKDYQSRQKAYEQALLNNSPHAPRLLENLSRARKRLELAILNNTPGVSEMDLPINREAGQPTPITPRNINPFGGEQITITVEQGSPSPQPQATHVPQTVSPTQTAQTVPSAQQSQTPAAATSAPQAQPAQSSSSTSPARGFEYIRVRPGDSLWAICQRYYGDGGMWSHILGYQIPAIAATPNLIFPGQIIALPRRIGSSMPSGHDPGAGVSAPPTPPSATTPAPKGDESWQDRFQRDYLISDHTLTNSNTMTIAQIQSFLDKKKSVLAKPYRGSSPAKMIYDAAKKHGINPQVLLTRLQCEQGLISRTTATQHQLDWALGVGCYDSGNWNQKFKGLDKQIEWAAATYRRHYNDAKAKLDRGETITMRIDGRDVKVRNAASYSFYKYCPHFHGNKLFYDVWRGYRKYF